MSPFLKYTVLRLGLFVMSLGVLSIFARGWLLLLLAALVSLVLSYVLLGRYRDEMTASVSSRVEARHSGRMSRGLAEDDAAEDQAVDGSAGGPVDGVDGDRRPGTPA